MKIAVAVLAVALLVRADIARAQTSQEREIQLRPAGERETPLELVGL